MVLIRYESFRPAKEALSRQGAFQISPKGSIIRESSWGSFGSKSAGLTMVTFAYAGPVIASIAFNAFGSALATICVYLYLHRDRLKVHRKLMALSKPFHKLIVKIAKGRIAKIKKKKLGNEGKAYQRPTA